MDEREQLGKDLKKILREIQKNCKLTEKQFKKICLQALHGGKILLKSVEAMAQFQVLLTI